MNSFTPDTDSGKAKCNHILAYPVAGGKNLRILLSPFLEESEIIFSSEFVFLVKLSILFELEAALGHLLLTPPKRFTSSPSLRRRTRRRSSPSLYLLPSWWCSDVVWTDMYLYIYVFLISRIPIGALLSMSDWMPPSLASTWCINREQSAPSLTPRHPFHFSRALGFSFFYFLLYISLLLL